MNLRPDWVVSDQMSTLSQATHSDVVGLREQTEALHVRTERLQSHADRNWRQWPVLYLYKRAKSNMITGVSKPIVAMVKTSGPIH